MSTHHSIDDTSLASPIFDEDIAIVSVYFNPSVILPLYRLYLSDVFYNKQWICIYST